MKTQVDLKHFILFVLSISILAFSFPHDSHAAVAGDCEACHALYPGMMEAAEPGKPPQYVLKNALCVNCHSHNKQDTIKELGGAQVPVVYNSVRPRKPLAGGNFYYVGKDFGDRRGHNVDGITSLDAKFMNHAPGYERIDDPSGIGYNPEKPLTCAGSNGCHGNRNVGDPFLSIVGSHHTDDSVIDGRTTGTSYRFLKNTDRAKGVVGLEDSEWNQNASPVKHNEYSPSIDQFCASCHGYFHDKAMTGKESPFFRHPTGIVLPKVGEYASYNPGVAPPSEIPDVRVYNPDAPVGRAKIPVAPSDEVKPGEDTVLCLSCHVAHSSPYDSLLKWDYESIIAGEGGGDGCFICHTGKGE